MLIRFLTLIFISCSIARSATVYHPLKPRSDFQTLSSQWACQTTFYLNNSKKCNPGLFDFQKSEGLSIGLHSKADGDAIDNGKRLIFDPIEEDLLRDLFRNDNFNSLTFDSSLQFMTSYFNITYDPFYLLADVYLSNPAFAYASVNVANREEIYLTAGKKYSTTEIGIDGELGVGLNLGYYSMDYSDSTFSLIDLASKKAADLIETKKYSGLLLDLGVVHQSKSWIPDLGIQVKNAFADFTNDVDKVDSVDVLTPLMLFDTYSMLSLGETVETGFGGFHFEVMFPFEKYFQYFYTQYIVGSVSYTTGLMTLVSSVSKYHQSAGIMFQSRKLSIGIIYSWEQDLGEYSNYSKDSAYFNMEIFL